ncbi:PQQ-dependent sugar dehydrogenase [Devosia sp. Naph2]|uniref:PQQ-dependent sugar dehydrogenase n=1 Tax=Devosia polycyclovorans TaxID=3345148 RepID=UPI0035D04787
MTFTARLLCGTILSAGLMAGPAFAQAEPVQTGPANAPDQVPAFEGQRRASQPESPVEVTQEVIAEGLPHLWAMEFLPDGRMLVTAKSGVLHIITPEGEVSEAIAGLPEVDAVGQGGLLDVALAPDFAETGRIYVSYSEPRESGNGTSVASARLVLADGGGASLEDVEVIFRQEPTYDGRLHFGSRIVPTEDGNLYVTVGERSDDPIRDQAQELQSGLGKIFRITPDGEPVDGNPFIEGNDGALPEIWSLGHRNVQSATLDDDGRLWIVEHGARGGDELNQPEAGLNYGWPEVAYGVTYGGAPIEGGITQSAETEQPVYYWDPVIAPSGMANYQGNEFPEWDDTFLVGGLVAQAVVVLHMEGDRVAQERHIDIGARVRDVRVGPDGAVYALTESRNTGQSSIVKLTKAG